MTKSELKKLIREIVASEIRSIKKEIITEVMDSVESKVIKEVKAEMFDVLVSNRGGISPQGNETVNANISETVNQPTSFNKQQLRQIFESTNPMSEFEEYSGRAPTPQINSVNDLPPTVEKVTPQGVELYQKLLRGGK